jgi:hypothetical protein
MSAARLAVAVGTTKEFAATAARAADDVAALGRLSFSVAPPAPCPFEPGSDRKLSTVEHHLRKILTIDAINAILSQRDVFTPLVSDLFAQR